jgi:hypothetical protein
MYHTVMVLNIETNAIKARFTLALHEVGNQNECCISCRLRPTLEWYADLTFLELPFLHTLYLFTTYNYILTRPEPQRKEMALRRDSI